MQAPINEPTRQQTLPPAQDDRPVTNFPATVPPAVSKDNIQLPAHTGSQPTPAAPVQGGQVLVPATPTDPPPGPMRSRFLGLSAKGLIFFVVAVVLAFLSLYEYNQIRELRASLENTSKDYSLLKQQSSEQFNQPSPARQVNPHSPIRPIRRLLSRLTSNWVQTLSGKFGKGYGLFPKNSKTR